MAKMEHTQTVASERLWSLVMVQFEINMCVIWCNYSTTNYVFCPAFIHFYELICNIFALQRQPQYCDCNSLKCHLKCLCMNYLYNDWFGRIVFISFHFVSFFFCLFVNKFKTIRLFMKTILSESVIENASKRQNSNSSILPKRIPTTCKTLCRCFHMACLCWQT